MNTICYNCSKIQPPKLPEHVKVEYFNEQDSSEESEFSVWIITDACVIVGEAVYLRVDNFRKVKHGTTTSFYYKKDGNTLYRLQLVHRTSGITGEISKSLTKDQSPETFLGESIMSYRVVETLDPNIFNRFEEFEFY